eukprot:2785781-Pleurochrysis_carterae.AAC.3
MLNVHLAAYRHGVVAIRAETDSGYSKVATPASCDIIAARPVGRKKVEYSSSDSILIAFRNFNDQNSLM